MKVGLGYFLEERNIEIEEYYYWNIFLQHIRNIIIYIFSHNILSSTGLYNFMYIIFIITKINIKINIMKYKFTINWKQCTSNIQSNENIS